MANFVRPKKALGQHFLTDQNVARGIVGALKGSGPVLEVGPGMGVLTEHLLARPDIDLKVIEIDSESVQYLLEHFPKIAGGLYEADFLKMPLEKLFEGSFAVIGNFPYNISSQIFFKILDYRSQVPEVVCMIQKEVAERLAAGPGSKTYGILSVLLQAWYDIEYLFTVGEGSFVPPPKVKSAVIRLTRNSRTELTAPDGRKVDEVLLRKVVKTSFNQRRKTLRNSLKPLLAELNIPQPSADGGGQTASPLDRWQSLRPEQLSVEDFLALTADLTA